MFFNNLAGAKFTIRQLRVLMQITTPADHLLLHTRRQLSSIRHSIGRCLHRIKTRAHKA